MKRTIIAIAATLALSGPLLAQSPAPPSPVKPAAPSPVSTDKKPLTVAACVDLLAGLDALNYVGEQLADPQHPVPTPPNAQQYNLGAATYTIALDASLLRPVSQAMQEARQRVFKEVGKGKPIQDGSPEATILQDKLAEILKGPCIVALGDINLSDLNLGPGPTQNKIPPTVVSVLIPIIKQ